MQQNNVEIKEKVNSKIVINQEKDISLTGVSKVNSATKNCVNVVINNKNVVIEGNNLQVKKLDVECGIVEIEGSVCVLKLDKQKNEKNLFKKIFS